MNFWVYLEKFACIDKYHLNVDGCSSCYYIQTEVFHPVQQHKIFSMLLLDIASVDHLLHKNCRFYCTVHVLQKFLCQYLGFLQAVSCLHKFGIDCCNLLTCCCVGQMSCTFLEGGILSMISSTSTIVRMVCTVNNPLTQSILFQSFWDHLVVRLWHC